MKPLLTCGSPKINVRNLTDATGQSEILGAIFIYMSGYVQPSMLVKGD